LPYSVQDFRFLLLCYFCIFRIAHRALIQAVFGGGKRQKFRDNATEGLKTPFLGILKAGGVVAKIAMKKNVCIDRFFIQEIFEHKSTRKK
jgi:hypothetical protein